MAPLLYNTDQAFKEYMFNIINRFGLDCSLEIMFLATHRPHRYKKLGKLLCQVSIELAKKLKDGPVSTMSVKDFGPKYAFMPERKPVSSIPKFCQALWTAEPTQKIGKALGFSVYLRIPFTEFSFNGKTYTERLGADVWCEAVALHL